MIKKDFSLVHLLQIKTVFPSAYSYTWENTFGRYGKRIAKFELEVKVNLEHNMEKLGPNLMIERKKIFHNALVNLVIRHHSEFCVGLKTPVKLRNFDVNLCPPVPEFNLPVKPCVRVIPAAEMLQQSRRLFEMNPADVTITQKSASRPIRKELEGLNPNLIQKIQEKEAENAAKDMYTDKAEEEKLKRLRRLPVLARILKNVFISEEKTSLEFDTVIKKAVFSYPGYISTEKITADLKYLIEVTGPWATTPKVQGIEYIKIDKKICVNTIVEKLEGLLSPTSPPLLSTSHSSTSSKSQPSSNSPSKSDPPSTSPGKTSPKPIAISAITSASDPTTNDSLVRQLVEQPCPTVRPYVCIHCEQNFQLKHHLTLHSTTCTRKRKKYTCKVCDRKFVNNMLKSKHEIQCKTKIQAKLKCKECDEEFMNLDKKRYHVNMKHSKKLECEFCDFEPKQAKNLKRHMRSVHPNMTPSKLKRYEIELSQREFQCLKCKKTYCNRSGLHKHKQKNKMCQ